jgi:DNA topoisomerase VI subunit A
MDRFYEDDDDDDAAYDNNDKDEQQQQVIDPSIVTTAMVLRRIEKVAERIVQCLDDGNLPEMTQSVEHSNSDNENELQPNPTLVKRFSLHQCRSFTSMLLVMSYCHALLSSWNNSTGTKKTVTTREVYYVHVTHFRHQRECNDAIKSVCILLQVPRHALGLQASARGWLCGDVTLVRNSAANNSTNSHHQGPQQQQQHHDDGDGHQWYSDDDDEVDDHGGSGGSRNAADSEGGVPIVADWLLPPSQRAFWLHPHTTATCIVLIEKEGIYQRLVQDGLWRDHHCILITGKGFPDWATRACVHALHTTWPHLPVYGLADCDPYGIAVLQCFARGISTSAMTSATSSTRQRQDGMEHSQPQYSIPVQWMGLRPSQVQHLSHGDSCLWNQGQMYPQLPAAVRQSLTARDRKLLRQFLGPLPEHESNEALRGGTHHPFPDRTCLPLTRDPDHCRLLRHKEMHAMLNGEHKVELEALYWIGMDFCALFVGRLIELQQQQPLPPMHTAPHWMDIL